MREFLQAFRLAKGQWWRRLIVVLGMLGESGSLILAPLLVKQGFDLLAAPPPAAELLPALNRVALQVMALGVMRAVAIYVEIYFQENLGNHIGYDIRQMLCRKLLRLPFSFFDRTKTGNLMSILTKDVDAVRDGVGFVVLILILNIMTMTGIVIAMVRLDAEFAAIVLATVPLLMALAVFYNRLVGPMYKKVQETSGQLHTVAQENVSGIRVVKAFVRHRQQEEKFARENEELYGANLRIARLNSVVHPGLDLLGGAAQLIALGLGGVYVIKGEITLGTLIAFTNYAEFMVWIPRELGWLTEMIQRALAGARRVFRVLHEREELPEPEAGGVDRPITGSISFENVSFSYPDGEQVLHDFSLQVKPGEKVCILGVTGSGKTTVANLIPRFYDTTRGTVKIDGIDVRNWKLSSLRRQIGFVFQDNFLFSATLYENLTMGRKNVAPQALDSMVEAAQARGFISQLPKEYETKVGERGIGLSGGERQRVAIARALLKDPRILILDDATASLDVRTEARLKKALEKYFDGKTVVIVAQRVSTARDADRIVVLDRGRIIEEGTHQQLMAKDGFYAYLTKVQAMNEEDTGDMSREELEVGLLG